MAQTQLIRRLGLSGDYLDDDWTNPANPVPQNARKFKIVADRVLFDIVGKASTAFDAVEVDVGAMVVDAWVGYEGKPRDPADPTGPKRIRRGLSVVEATGSTLSTRIRLEVVGATRGAMAVLNLNLTGVGGLTCVDVELVDGAVPK